MTNTNMFLKVLAKTDIRFEFSVKSYVFQHWSKNMVDIFWKMSKLEAYNLKNSLKYSFSVVGSIKNDFSWSKAAWSICQSLLWLGKLYFWRFTSQRNIKIETDKLSFLLNGWKLCQKMRLDALIIFLIEWRHQVSYLGGKQSKYCNKKT